MSERRSFPIPARVLSFGLAVVVFVGLAWGVQRLFGPTKRDPQNPPMHRFAGVTGPAHETMVPAATPADWRQFDHGDPSRLAILLTDEESDWLGLAHGFRSMGIPFRITRDAAEATRHRLVLVYPTISGRALTPEALRALARHPESGGVLIGFGIEGGGLQEVFGFDAATPSRAHRVLHLAEAPVLSELTGAAERELPVNSSDKDSTLTLLSFDPTTARPLAVYEDGRAGVLHRAVGNGHAYAFGFDLGHLILKGFNDRQEGLARSYANQYAPIVDTWLRLLRRIYRDAEPAGVILHPVPAGQSLSVALSHDIDYTRSLVHAGAYAALEKGQGVAATYFVQAKYLQDWNDDIFMDEKAGPILRELHAAGAEIAGHSVSHSRTFESFPLGTGQERYPEYRPFVLNQKETLNASILGELRVTKFLLEHLTPGATVRSFRPGYLSNPFQLPQALAGTGYAFSSSTSANNALTHLPFHLTHSRNKTAPTAVYEFPVTIEDELPPALTTRLEQALGVADSIARYGGLYMVLIHTDTAGEKLEFQRRLTAELQRRGAWFGRLDAFATWWIARDRVELDARRSGETLTLRLRSPETIAGLALDLPGQPWRLIGGKGNVVRDGSRLIVDLQPGEQEFQLRR